MGKRELLGGGVLIAAGAALARETIYWVWGQFLAALTAGMGEPVTWLNFPWLNLLGLILMVIGLWVVFRSKPRNERAEACADLHAKMSGVYDRLCNVLAVQQVVYYPDIIGEVAAVFRSLEDMGIPTPEINVPDLLNAYRTSYLFIGALMPSIRDNHVAFARTESLKIIAGIGAKPSPLPSRFKLTRPKPNQSNVEPAQ